METLTAAPPERPARRGSTLDALPLARLLLDAAREPGGGWSPGGAAMLGAAACLGLLAAVFAPTLGHFVQTWSTDENYSHGFLVPLISLYFANEAARLGPTPVRGGVGIGLAMIVFALLGRMATTVVPVGFVGDLALILGLAGVVALLAGAAALRRYGFALGFLVFMVPLPIALYTAIASPLQRLVSRLSAAILNAGGIPVLTQGNMMTLPGDVQLFVAEACSGMRQLTGFLALTTAVAYLASRPGWFRAVLVASAIPIALTANVLRVTLTGLIAYHLSPEWVTGQFHTIEGLLMMGVGLALLAAECAALNGLVSRPAKPGEP